MTRDMDLTSEEAAILAGERGEALRKVMASVVRYGEVFDADRLVPLDGPGHLVMSMGVGILRPLYRMLDEITAAGLRTAWPFTLDPHPLRYQGIRTGLLTRWVFRWMYGAQDRLETAYRAIGLREGDPFSCACYLPEVGNTPRFGDRLAWAESSAVAYANSVLGARTNRNAGGIELLCNLLGKAPRYGLLTDAGRQATWHVEVATSQRPDPQLLGAAIGLRVMEDVPYLSGLDRFLPEVGDPASAAWCKDLGAAAAASGAVGLLHVEGLTPEARDAGRGLLARETRTYRIDDAELARVAGSFPHAWKRPGAPHKCFIGCPHLAYEQVLAWADRILAASGGRALAVETVLLTAPPVRDHVRASHAALVARLARVGCRLSTTCPLLYLANPLTAGLRVVTSSCKLRTYTSARFLGEDALLDAIVRGRLPEDER